MSEDELSRVRKHAQDSAERISAQKKRIARMRAAGEDTTLSEDVLANFEDAQSLRFQHLRRIKDR